MTEPLTDAPPEIEPDGAALEPYEATLFHIELIRNKVNKLLAAQIDAERQLLHRAGRDYVAGRLSNAGLVALYHRYRDTVFPEDEDGQRRFTVKRPSVSGLWNEAFPITSDKVAYLGMYVPNGPHGSWEGEYPLGYAPRPPDGQSVVYVLFDEANVPCYVGSTQRFKGRLQAHERDKKFRRWVAYPCTDREAAYQLEERLLREHKPYLNKKASR